MIDCGKRQTPTVTPAKPGDYPVYLAEKQLSPEEHYLQRKPEVTQQDHEEFVAYLEEERAREEQKRAEQSKPVQVAPAPAESAWAAASKLNRRSFLTVVAGTAAYG